jgi:PIN domain nuclease of toxin-antitoxin system
VKHEKGQLILPASPSVYFPRAIKLHGLRLIAPSSHILLRATVLPPIHRDPMDRIIIATAQARKCTVITPDPLIRQYPDVQTLW